jgi:crotonobetainyl-CoA:carnitine CoA-transferase CaiB-like acyl-CoA transferase
MRYLSTRTTTDKLFAIALVLKAIDALGEVAGGLWLLLIDPQWWQGRVAALVAPELREDPRFATNRARLANLELVIDAIESWLGERSEEEVLRAFAEAHLPIAPILTVAEAMEHPHFRERGIVREVDDPVLGKLELPGMPLRFSSDPGALPLVAPFLGEHNREILTGLLGYGPSELDQLERDAVLGREAESRDAIRPPSPRSPGE